MQSSDIPVFVIVTADNCGHCRNFKEKQWPFLKQKLQNDGRVKIIEIPLPTMGTIPGEEYHSDLVKYIGWYPTFLLFNGSTWNNKMTILKGLIYSGEIVNGKPTYRNGESGDADSIYKWVISRLQDPVITSLDQSYVTKSSNINTGETKLIPTVGKSYPYRQRII